VHFPEYLDLLDAMAARGGRLARCRHVSRPPELESVLASGGVALAAVRTGPADCRAFGITRPPGHHALAARAMGFCFLNNVVLAARQAQALGCARVLIADWDVHHGNGTQALVEHDPVHSLRLHAPGSVVSGNGGRGRARRRNVFNVPRPGGLPRAVYVRDFLAGVDAALAQWSPDILLVSAGFDSLAGDPLGEFTLEPEDIVQWTEALRERMGTRPVVGVLEGGYRLDLLAAGVVAFVRALS